MTERSPRYPILVRDRDGEWSFDNATELASTLEWFDSDDPDEEAEVTDALVRPVSVRVDGHRILRFELAPAIPVRGPLMFLGPDGDVTVFHTEFRAVLYAEAIDVNNGEYGDYGWDADGRPIALVTRDPNTQARLARPAVRASP